MDIVGQVTDVGSPAQVRIYGDDIDTPVPLANADIVGLTTGDKVLLAQVGGTFVIVCVLEAT